MSETPSSQSAAVSFAKLQPAGAQTRDLSASKRTPPSSSASEMSVPSVSQSGMNEWPAPTTRTLRAFCTNPASSVSVFGRAICCGVALTLPDQFFHCMNATSLHAHARRDA